MTIPTTNIATLWKIMAEIEVEPGDLNLESGYTKGFMNVIMWGDCSNAVRDRLSSYLKSFNWQLLSVQEMFPVEELGDCGEDLMEMIEKARMNPQAIILGHFHSYKERPN